MNHVLIPASVEGGISPLICASKDCPYAVLENGGAGVVHASICTLCKKCEFSIEGEPEETASEVPGLTAQELHNVTKFLSEDPKISSSILGQHQFLRKENRIPLVILISSKTLNAALDTVCQTAERKQLLISHYLCEGGPLCTILGCPVYFSSKLTLSPVQVVGEIQWR